jgi:hypothetical protein
MAAEFCRPSSWIQRVVVFRAHQDGMQILGVHYDTGPKLKGYSFYYMYRNERRTALCLDPSYNITV